MAPASAGRNAAAATPASPARNASRGRRPSAKRAAASRQASKQNASGVVVQGTTHDHNAFCGSTVVATNKAAPIARPCGTPARSRADKAANTQSEPTKEARSGNRKGCAGVSRANGAPSRG